MKKWFLIMVLPFILSACATSDFDVTNQNKYGVRCSPDSVTQPNWQACERVARKTCGVQHISNIVQHDPTGSGGPEDVYFLTFECH